MNDVLEILKSCDAFLEGHFLLSSGRHSSAYCQMAYLQQYPEKCAAATGFMAAAHFSGHCCRYAIWQ